MNHPLKTSSVVLALGLLTAAATASGQSASSNDASQTINKSDALEQVVVTAQRYRSTIQDTPISISALSGDQLVASGISTVSDVAHDIPGLSMRSAGPGLTEFEARGLASTGGAAPTVGFYLDEVPLSPPALSQSGKIVIDPDLYDVDRVEVLRGPQGTLYGSGSMGGTIKIVTNQPKIGVFEGSAQGTASYTDGGNANGGGNLMLNLPLGDVLAVRIVGSDSYRSGWIDRVVLNPFPPENGTTRGDVLTAPVQSVASDVNTERLYGGRVSVLYKPNEDWSVIATALYQNLEMGGYDLIDSPPGLPYLAHYEAFNTPEPITDKVHIYSLTITGNLGFGELTSATSYWDRMTVQTQDGAESIAATLGTPLVPVGYSEADPSHQFSQEIRLSSLGNGAAHWTVGAFYSDMTSQWNEYGANPANTAAPGGIYFESYNPYNIKQSAIFGDGSYKLTDTLTLAAGVRWYSYDSTIDVSEWGSVTPNPTQPASPSVTKASATGFNPRVNLSYEPNPSLNTYITAAKGFRPGGANILIPPPNQPPNCVAGSPETFGPDSVWNYEIGEKAKLFDNRVSINADVYYIKWTGIQQSVPLACGYVYNTNAGDGRSYGPEIEVTARLTDAWTVAANGAVTNAEITSPTFAYATSIYGTNGQLYCPSGNCTIPILNVPHQTAGLSLVYSSDIGNGYRLTARASDTYTGYATDEAFYFGVHLPPYAIAAARVTLAHGAWSAHLFVDNLTNKIALMTANNTQFQFNIPQLTRYTVNQPRTIGTQLNYKF
jgi:outer membrane receptor protein involved in Fe transport